MLVIARDSGPVNQYFSTAPEIGQVDGDEYEHDADVREEALQCVVTKEGDVGPDDDGDHHDDEERGDGL